MRTGTLFQPVQPGARFDVTRKLLQRFHPNLDLQPEPADLRVVKPFTLGRKLSILAVGVALLSRPAFASSHTPVLEVVPVGDNTFSITETGKTAFARDTDKMRADVQEQATSYCVAQGKQLKVLELTSEKPFFSTGYASAKIVFKAVAPGELEPVPTTLASTHTPGNTGSAPTEVGTPSATGDLYTDLMKLDELHRKGILTDKEFKAEKKKVLARSR